MEPRSRQLGTLPIGKLLFNLSMPAMGAMLVMSLYNVVDTIFVGHGVGALAIGGLAIVFPLQMLFMAVGFFFGVGGASLYSRALGAGDRESASLALGNSLGGAAVTGMALFLVMLFARDPVLAAFGARDPNLLKYAREYYDIIIIGVPFISIAVAGNNIIRAAGHARTAMMTMLISAVINMILDPIFIFGLKMGVKGAALATIIAQALTMVWVIGYFRSRHSETRLTTHSLPFRKPVMKEIGRVGISSLARQAAQTAMLAVFNNLFLIYSGPTAVSAFGTIFRPLSLAIMPLFGIAQALQPIAGYNFGARQFTRVRRSFHLSWKAGTVYAMIATAVFMLFPEPFLKIFLRAEDIRKNPELLTIGVAGIRHLQIFFSLAAYQIMAGALFQALGRGIPAFVTSISRQLLFLIPMGVILPRFMGFKGVLLAFPAAEILGFILSLWLIRGEMQILRKNEISG